MKEAELLRALADQLDQLDAVKLFPTDIDHPGELTVNWSEGADHEGYGALNDAISELVKQHWNALRSQVVKSREASVQAARVAWSEAGKTVAKQAEAA